MNKETIFFILFTVWYFNRNKLSKYLPLLYQNYFLFKNNCFAIYKYIFNDNYDLESEFDINEENKEDKRLEKELPKYEDKFLLDIRKLEKNFIFNEKELEQKMVKFNELYCNFEKVGTYSEEKCKELAENESFDFIKKEHLNKLKNSFVIEYTPLGNVLMIYDIERETFKYYSDNNIPYRFLEVVGRKYVKQFNCRSIFVDMEDELLQSEDKWEKERKEKEEKEMEEKRQKEDSIKNNQIPKEVKKSVFAKFKSYNRESGTGHVNIAAPPKNSIPNKIITEKQTNEKILLKEKANRYTYEGKFANFSFLKKADKKIFDNKLKLSFSDFKKMKINK